MTPDLTPSTVVDELLAKRGLERRVHMSVPHFAVAPFIVASSDLALTAPTRLLDPFIRLLRLRRLELPIKVPTYHLSQVWARRSGDDAGHQWLRANVARLFVQDA
jgi:DNA-binding transcriptional LysR family regulator